MVSMALIKPGVFEHLNVDGVEVMASRGSQNGVEFKLFEAVASRSPFVNTFSFVLKDLRFQSYIQALIE